jgi:leucyl/phenylalanyl-tRNA--protein transferase
LRLKPIHLFPDVSKARTDGLLAIGGDLSVTTLQTAYRSGIFPWFSGQVPMWYSPDPRFVLFPAELKISKSMKQVIRSGRFSFSVDKEFNTVINHCSHVNREGQDSTWITSGMIEAYTALHEAGMAHSIETWQDGKLAGGLYGVRVGRVFCGESMFSLQPNASKFALIDYVQQVSADGVDLIDCQVYTPHLESLGARMIPREEYLQYLSMEDAGH